MSACHKHSDIFFDPDRTPVKMSTINRISGFGIISDRRERLK
jgi:hypothetical protein